MKILWSLIIITVTLAGCGSEGMLSVDEKVTGSIETEDVLRIAGQSGQGGTDDAPIVSNIGAQILKGKYDRYSRAGMTESDFGRMPDNELTSNLKRLYLDMKPLMD